MVESVLRAFVFHCLAVAVHSFVITYSTPQQCGDVEIAWTKTSTSAAQLDFPLLLYILPFDSTATSQQITGWNASMTSGSAVVKSTFNPTNGTKLLLAITDGAGRGVGPVSGVKTVMPSPDASCLSSNTRSSPSHFQVFTTPTPSECPSLDVRWDGTVKSPRPTILGFSPGQHPVDMVPPLSPLPMERSVLSKGAFTSMSKVVVLFRDQASSGQTSQFLTVGGTDRDTCSSPPNSTADAPKSSTLTCVAQSNSFSTKSAGIVIGATLAGIVGLAILLLAIFTYRRWRHDAIQGPEAVPQILSAKTETLPSRPSASSSDDLPLVPPSISPISIRSENQSDQEEQAQDPERDTVTTPSPVTIAHAVSLPFPVSPMTKRRSWTSRRSTRSMSTEESNFLQFTEASIFRPIPPNETDASNQLFNDGQFPRVPEDPVLRPDSPTLPQQYAVPATPQTSRARSLRSQRLERREQYVMLDPTSTTPPFRESCEALRVHQAGA